METTEFSPRMTVAKICPVGNAEEGNLSISIVCTNKQQSVFPWVGQINETPFTQQRTQTDHIKLEQDCAEVPSVIFSSFIRAPWSAPLAHPRRAVITAVQEAAHNPLSRGHTLSLGS